MPSKQNTIVNGTHRGRIKASHNEILKQWLKMTAMTAQWNGKREREYVAVRIIADLSYAQYFSILLATMRALLLFAVVAVLVVSSVCLIILWFSVDSMSFRFVFLIRVSYNFSRALLLFSESFCSCISFADKHRMIFECAKMLNKTLYYQRHRVPYVISICNTNTKNLSVKASNI